MGTYQFEIIMSVSDIMDIEADSYDEACALATEEAEQGYYCVTPAGYSVSWDHVDVTCIEEPDEEED